ncbi:hypothetical protein [uncultured Dokdonia sp.]|uniref:hypothetical protein n=1 Tax=uncultured Dokdonia sp. TaxID=575653 RepID=UPI00261852A5|nr:hypothetical protein [uncultured Dokdonia sp.]
MLKNILKLNGAQELSKNEQTSINGGYNFIITNIPCSNIFDCLAAGTDRCYFGATPGNENGRCVIF